MILFLFRSFLKEELLVLHLWIMLPRNTLLAFFFIAARDALLVPNLFYKD